MNQPQPSTCSPLCWPVADVLAKLSSGFAHPPTVVTVVGTAPGTSLTL